MLPSKSSYRVWQEVTDKLELKFHEGIYLARPQIVEECIKKGVNPNVTDDDDLTALHISCIRGDLVIGKILLKSEGIDINNQDPEGHTALMYACMYEKEEFAKELLHHGANPNLRNGRLQTAIHLSCIQSNTRITLLLIMNGAEINVRDAFDNTPVSLAVNERGSIPLTTLLLRKGGSATGVKQFPLFLECVLSCNSEERLQIIKILLHYDVDIYCVHPISQRNCLHYVGITGYLPAAKALARRGIENLFVTDLVDRTPKDIAWDHKNFVVYKYFDEKVEVRRMTEIFDDEPLLSTDEISEDNFL